MTTRSIHPKDIAKIKIIHERFYKEEFDLPNFFNNFYAAYIIENDEGIIVAGGVRPIAEAVIVTNLDVSTRTRVEALEEMLTAAVFTCEIVKQDQLHCFVQDATWLRQLRTANFRPTKGQSLVLDIG